MYNYQGTIEEVPKPITEIGNVVFELPTVIAALPDLFIVKN